MNKLEKLLLQKLKDNNVDVSDILESEKKSKPKPKKKPVKKHASSRKQKIKIEPEDEELIPEKPKTVKLPSSEKIIAGVNDKKAGRIERVDPEKIRKTGNLFDSPEFASFRKMFKEDTTQTKKMLKKVAKTKGKFIATERIREPEKVKLVKCSQCGKEEEVKVSLLSNRSFYKCNACYGV